MTQNVVDGNITIHTGLSASCKSWVPLTTTWSQLVDRLSKPVVVKVNANEFKYMTSTDKARYKDVGGYVGGRLTDNKRGKDNILSRTLLVLDADNCESIGMLFESCCLSFNCACVVHSTFSHTEESPRARLIIPLRSEVTPKQYKTLAEYIMEKLGNDNFDKSSSEPNRLMFWPAIPIDGKYEFRVNEDDWLDPNEHLLARAHLDAATIFNTQDPTQLPGIVGKFCARFPIAEAIAEFLSEVYVKIGERYKYTEADSTAGLVIYKDGKLCYSHHSSDPAFGKLLNAYELVKLHKFGGSPRADQEMAELIAKLDIEQDWADQLQVDRKGIPLSTINNMYLVLRHDKDVANKFYYDQFADKLMVSDDFPWLGWLDRTSMVWNDLDDSGLKHFFESKYGMDNSAKAYDALALSASDKAIHPIREYFKTLAWDGVPRVDELLIKFMNAEDSAYVRAVTRKALLGAVARVMEPGCKHDHVLVLVGPQGCRKSTTIKLLGGKWYSDSLNTMQQGKDAYEQLQGNWIIEIGEMAATKKADIEQMKHFITKQSDNYRAAYARRTIDRPRQCAFFGSTNDTEFIKDTTGGRRFWPVSVSKVTVPVYAQLTKEYIDQIWAEVYAAYRTGEQWYLEEQQEAEAVEVQKEYTFVDNRKGLIEDFLNRPVPLNWYDKTIAERLEYHAFNTIADPENSRPRQKICALELWLELFNGKAVDLTPQKARELNAILDTIPGWRKTGSIRCGRDYGVQRGYTRI